jgi:hypothetical protein
MATEHTRKEPGKPDQKDACWPFSGDMARMGEGCGCGCRDFGSMMDRAAEFCRSTMTQDSPCCEGRGDQATETSSDQGPEATAESG